MTFATATMTIGDPPGRRAPEWVPAAEVAEALGVDQDALAEVAHLASPRLAQLPSGAQELQLDASKVWRVAQSLGVKKLPDRFQPKP